MPKKVCSARATVISGQVYTGGGVSEHEAEHFVVCKYDLVKNEWSTLPPAPIRFFGIGQLNGKLVLVGGKLENEKRTADVHVFEDSQQWEKSIPAMPSPRSAAAVSNHKDLLVVCGGRSGTGEPCATVFVYSGLTLQWSSVGPLSFASWRQSSVVLHNSLFVAGGFYSTIINQQRRSVVSAILPSCSVVHDLPDMPHYESSIATIGGSILAIGGVSKVDPMSIKLTAMTTLRKSLTVYRESTSSKVYAYCPTTSSWIHISDLPVPQNSVATATLPSGELLVMGGGNIDSDVSNTVFMGSITLEQ